MNRLLFTLATCAIFLFSCGSTDADQAATTDNQTKVPEAEYNEPVDENLYVKGDLLYAWVEGLSVREKPNTSAKRIGRVSPNEPLTFTGNRSSDSITLVMRGVVYQEPWYEITTADKKNGWVYGGGVKRKDERKGNAPFTRTKFNFPGFGKFDLSEWEPLAEASESEEGGDVVRVVNGYKKEDQRLYIDEIDAGDYGYRYVYTLTDDKDNLQKRRSFHFEVLPDLMLNEIIVDYLATPPVAHQRMQPVPQHLQMSVGDRPVMARGEWVEIPVPAEK